jgi:uncharacterized membrane protein YkgB
MDIRTLALRADNLELAPKLACLGLCLVLFWIGAQKITPTEAEGISPLFIHSPLVHWTYGVFGKQGATIAIGIYEYITGIGLIAGFFRPRVGLIAATMAMIMFVVTFSFFISTPGTVAEADGVYGPTVTGEFLLKDVTLFSAALNLFTYYGRKA